MTGYSPRAARGMVAGGFALLTAFAALTAVAHWRVDRTRFVPSEELMAELGEATIVDDPPPTPHTWPGWLGSHRNGVAALDRMARSWPVNGPRRQWRVAGGDGHSSFAVDGERVYGTLGRDGAEVIVCLALDTGREVWAVPHTPQTQSEGYEGPRATPTVRGDRLWTVTSDGVVLCLSTADGKERWRCDLPATFAARPPRWGYACSPLVVGETVYVTPGGRRGGAVAALRADTGAVVWSSQDDSAGYSSPVSAVIDGVAQVVFFTARRLIGVAPSDGKLLWELPWPTAFEVNAATPLVVRAERAGKELTYLFVSSGYGQGCALVKVESAAGGRFVARPVYQSNELCCHFATPVRYRDYVYGLDETRDLTCFDLRTGRVAWRFEKPDEGDEADGLRRVSYKKGSLLRVADVLIVLGEEGKLALVEATPEGYRELAAVRPFRDRCWTLPVLARGQLIVRDRRSIACYDLRPE